MANITELQLQGDSTIHKLNDARITTTAVDTATHILTMATNNGETSIAPITVANLASVLGVIEQYDATHFTDANDIRENCMVGVAGVSSSNYHVPQNYGILLVLRPIMGSYTTQLFFPHVNGTNDTNLYFRFNNSENWSNWVMLTGTLQS